MTATGPANGAVFIADVLGAVFAFSAIQTALLQRERTGAGQSIDVALMNSMLNLLVYELQEAQFPVATPRPTYGPVRARDGDLLVAPITPRNFDALCAVTGLAALRDDSRFDTLPGRNIHWGQMMEVVETWTWERSVAHCVARLEAAGVPCAANADPVDTLADAELQQRGVFRTVSDGGGTFTGVNPPWKMLGSRAELGSRVPALGEHVDAALADWLKLDERERQRLRESGTFGKVKP